MNKDCSLKRSNEYNRLTKAQKSKIVQAMADIRVRLDLFLLEEVEAILREFENDMRESFKFHAY